MIKEEIMWAQNARSDWIVQGDRNTRYFQTVVKQRRAGCRILQLKTDDGTTIEGLKDIEISKSSIQKQIPNLYKPCWKS